MAMSGVALGAILANLGPTAHELCGGKAMSLALGFSTFFIGIGVLVTAPLSGQHKHTIDYMILLPVENLFANG